MIKGAGESRIRGALLSKVYTTSIPTTRRTDGVGYDAHGELSTSAQRGTTARRRTGLAVPVSPPVVKDVTATSAVSHTIIDVPTAQQTTCGIQRTRERHYVTRFVTARIITLVMLVAMTPELHARAGLRAPIDVGQTV